MSLPLSAAILTKNSARTLERTLASVRPLASEILAVDSGSTDDTFSLVEAFSARIIKTEWKGYNATAQFAVESCSTEWVLLIDSDESVEPDLAESIRTALATPDAGIAAFAMNRKVWYRGRYLNHAWQPEWRTRLVRRALVPHAIRYTGLDPHGALTLLDRAAGRIERLGGSLRHDTIADISTFMGSQVRWASAAARSLRSQGKRGSYVKLLTSPPGAFFKQMVLKQAFLDGWRGWCAAASTAAATLMKHAILIDLSRAENPNETHA